MAWLIGEFAEEAGEFFGVALTGEAEQHDLSERWASDFVPRRQCAAENAGAGVVEFAAMLLRLPGEMDHQDFTTGGVRRVVDVEHELHGEELRDYGQAAA